ncbi:MAG: FHA domain-containing protein [Hyphomicrobiaceae bacterium]
MTDNAKPNEAQQRASGFLGSLKDALAAASREEVARPRDKAAATPRPSGDRRAEVVALPPPVPAGAASAAEAAAHGTAREPVAQAAEKPAPSSAPLPAAEAAAREVRGSVTLRPAAEAAPDRRVEAELPPTTRVVRAEKAKATSAPAASEPARTQLVRGRQKLVRNDFQQDPVVGWLVVVGGPGLGAFRPVFEGNNTIGRSENQRIPIDFGDEAISSEEQAYIRYDSSDRSFLFVPNLAKTNVVRINEKKPTSAVELAHMDVITMGRTQLVFVPFCGSDFDWAELADVKD